jgi:hypothetical protein
MNTYYLILYTQNFKISICNQYKNEKWNIFHPFDACNKVFKITCVFYAYDISQFGLATSEVF